MKTAYLAVLFFWLSIFSVIPVVHSYFSVRYFEENLWKQQQLFKIAEENRKLLNTEKDFNLPWINRIQGNGIDKINVKYFPDVKPDGKETKNTETDLTTSEIIYASLPDPIRNGFSHRELLKAKKQETNWQLSGDSLVVNTIDQKGKIHVKAGKKPTTAKEHIFLLGLVFLLAAFCIWHLVKFAATVFLNLDNEKPKLSNVQWTVFFNSDGAKRILLKTFNGDLFLTETINAEKDKNEKAIELAQAVTICQPGFNSEQFLKNAGNIIWITGLNECIPEIAKHNLLLDSITAFNHDNTKKIVVDLPFELKIIDEYYDDYISFNELTTKELTEIFILRKKWKITFEDYISYDGFLYQVKTDEPENKLTGQHVQKYFENINRELIYSMIWKNLTYHEKIVLYDLVDDGLMNRNNKKIIAQLIEKKLILIKLFPVLFARDFSDYILNNISISEVRTIEVKLGLKSNWKNAKYLILLILIPLAAFIFISQGLTIEKSFGIFAGLVGAITTLLKLFESSPIKTK
jgi:hypothetical protein